MPPARSKTLRRTNMQPPAAPVLFERGGYKRKKKNTNAGISARSASVEQWSRTISDTMS